MAFVTKTFHHAPYTAISPELSENNQTSQVVLISGATTGIGFAIAKAFVQAKASRIIITGRRSDVLKRAEEELQAMSNASDILSYNCDIMNVLVLNAANTAHRPAHPISGFLPQLQTAFDTNLFGNMLHISQFIEQPLSDNVKSNRAIINISSLSAHANPSPSQAAYSTSKAALAHTLQLLADEVPAEQCQIISMHPGAIMTEAAEKAPQEVKDSVVWDEPELPGNFAVWASSQQAAFLHGRFVWANWDVEELVTREHEFEDPGFLKFGSQGIEFVDRRTIFEKIRSSHVN